MIYDRIENAGLYYSHGIWQKAFDFIGKLGSDVPDGRQEILGNDLYADVSSYQTKMIETTIVEAHKRYMDIHLLLAGAEQIDCFPIEHLTVTQPYDETRDVALFQRNSQPTATSILGPGFFLFLHAHDAHSPGVAVENRPIYVKKVVLKINIEAFTRDSAKA